MRLWLIMIDKKLYPYLIAISKANTDNERRKLLLAADPKVIRAICEIIHNLIAGNITTNKRVLRKLLPHSPTLLRLQRTKRIDQQRKILSSQKGGSALPLILPVFATIAGGLIDKILNGRK